MTRYHMTDDGPKECPAQKRCRLQAAAEKRGENVAHFDSKSEADAAYQQILAKKNGDSVHSTLSKSSISSIGANKFATCEQDADKMVSDEINRWRKIFPNYSEKQLLADATKSIQSCASWRNDSPDAKNHKKLMNKSISKYAKTISNNSDNEKIISDLDRKELFGMPFALPKNNLATDAATARGFVKRYVDRNKMEGISEKESLSNLKSMIGRNGMCSEQFSKHLDNVEKVLSEFSEYSSPFIQHKQEYKIS